MLYHYIILYYNYYISIPSTIIITCNTNRLHCHLVQCIIIGFTVILSYYHVKDYIICFTTLYYLIVHYIICFKLYLHHITISHTMLYALLYYGFFFIRL